MDSAVGHALAETARDISSIRDPDLLFAAIAERTRAVMGTDMAYVSINDPSTGSTAIRATAGVRTEAYARIAMPLGTGVLGLAAGGSIVRTDDYLADTRRTHLPDVDEAVRGEGVRAIAGVPLTSAGAALGALMVADRRARSFTERQIEDLTALGHQAAVAAELHQAREWRVELDQSRRRLRFRGSVSADSTVDEIAESAARVFGADVAVFDGLGDPITVRAAIPSTRPAADLRDALRRSPEGAPIVDDEIAAATVHGVEGDSGFVVVSPPVSADCVSDVAEVVGIALLRSEALATSRQRTQQELLTDLLSFRPGDSGVLRRAAAARITPADTLVALAVSTPADRARATATALRTHLVDRGIVSTIDDEICAVVAVAADGDALDQVRALLAEMVAPDVTVGCAHPVVGLQRVGAAVAEARTVVAALHALGRTGVVADPSALGVAGMLLGSSSSGAVTALVDRQLGPLLRPGGARSEELLATMRTFFDADEGVARAADVLGLHVNTVRQRLERLDQLLGADWRTRRRLDVHVALVAHALRTAPLPTL